MLYRYLNFNEIERYIVAANNTTLPVVAYPSAGLAPN